MLNGTFSVIFKHCDPGEPWPFRSLFGRWSLSPGRSFQEGSVFALVLVGRQCNFCCVHFDLSHFDFHRYEHHCGRLFYFVDCMGNVGSLWIHSRNQRRKTGWNGFLCESSKRFLNRKYVKHKKNHKVKKNMLTNFLAEILTIFIRIKQKICK